LADAEHEGGLRSKSNVTAQKWSKGKQQYRMVNQDLDKHMGGNLPILLISGTTKEGDARGKCAQRRLEFPFLSLL
jgi:hypothetical protein